LESSKTVAFDAVYKEELRWIQARRCELHKSMLPVPEPRAAVREAEADDVTETSNRPEEQSQGAANETDAASEDNLDLNAGTLHELQENALNANLCGLAISGGGIRSATFGLGVLQGLAASGLLARFDYISTVSGGGYIGAWLSAWIRRDGFSTVVEQKLLPPRLQPDFPRNSAHSAEVEPDPIRHLRLYSNYLAPRPGLLSFDGWDLIAISLRNMLLNQLVLVLAILALFVGIRAIVEVYSIAHESTGARPPYVCGCIVVAGVLGGILGMARYSPGGVFYSPGTPLRIQSFWYSCIVPWLVASTALSVLHVFPNSAGWFHQRAFSASARIGTPWLMSLGEESLGTILFFAMFVMAVHVLLGSLAFGCRWQAIVAGGVTGFLCGAVLAISWMWLLEVANGPMTPRVDQNTTVAAAVTFGVPLTLTLCVLNCFFMVGLCGPLLSEVEREWWSSVNSRFLMLILGWLVVFGIAVFGPWIAGQAWSSLSRPGYLYKSLIGVGVTGWMGALTAGIQFARGSADTGTRGIRNTLARLAPVLFLITLLLAAAVATTWLCYDIHARVIEDQNLRFSQRLPFLLSDLNHAKLYLTKSFSLLACLAGVPSFEANVPIGWLVLAAAAILLGILSQWVGDLIGVNTFTLHNLYANRLVRCYLGASVPDPRPEPVVNFDPNDDIPISDLFPGMHAGSTASEGEPDEELTAELRSQWGPIPIINAALNQKASDLRGSGAGGAAETGSSAARRAESLHFLERQSESFVFTPLYCGSDSAGYCRSSEFAGNVKLGTAIAVSGAAVTPNMGYHSSPLVTALLTVFNVRLGAWFGNPKCENTRNQANPGASASLLFNELAGLTNASSDYVYHSDGGHFENMGVYELIRRRCRFIIAVDAGADPKFHENVGRVVRQVRIDFGIWIEIDMTPVTPNALGLCESHVVVGRIHYGDVHTPDYPDQSPGDPRFSYENNHGIIVWIKNSLTGDEPGDLVNHAAMHPPFPYDSTLDQFFDEPQFESYRALGVHTILKSMVLPDSPAPHKYDCGTMPVRMATHVDQRSARQTPHQRLRQTTTRSIFQTIFEFWQTKPAQYVSSYVAMNDAYAKILETLRADKDLEQLAWELYGAKSESPAAVPSSRIPGVPEKLMVNQMLALLENVFLSLDLERNCDHPVHAGWIGVFKNWLSSPTMAHCWRGTLRDNADGLCKEYSPAFRRFVNRFLNEQHIAEPRGYRGSR